MILRKQYSASPSLTLRLKALLQKDTHQVSRVYYSDKELKIEEPTLALRIAKKEI